MALTDENGGGIPATMLVGPATVGGNAMPYPYPMMGGMGGGMNNGMGGENGWWLILVIIIIAALGGGWGGNNSGNGAFGGGAPIVINDGGNGGSVQRGFDQAAVMSGLNGIQSGIYNLSTQLCNCCGDMQMAVANGFSQAEMANNARQITDMQQNFAAQMATMQGFTNVNSGIADLRYTEATEACATRTQSMVNTRDIIDVINNRAQGIENKLCQLELDGVKMNYENRIAGLQNALDQSRSDNQGLRFAASQTSQNAFIAQGLNNEVDALYSRLRDCPVPSMPVYGMQPIFTCPGNNNGGGFGCGAA